MVLLLCCVVSGSHMLSISIILYNGDSESILSFQIKSFRVNMTSNIVQLMAPYLSQINAELC